MHQVAPAGQHLTSQLIENVSLLTSMSPHRVDYRLAYARLSREIEADITRLLNVDVGAGYMVKMMHATAEGNVEQVDRAYKAAIANGYESDELHQNYAVSLHILGRVDDAIVVLRKILEINPGSPEAYLLLATYICDTGDFSNARDALEPGLRLKNSQINRDFEKYSNMFDFVSDLGISNEEVRAYFDHLNDFIRSEKLVLATQTFGINSDGDCSWITTVVDTKRPIEEVYELNDSFVDSLLEKDVPPHLLTSMVSRFI